MGSELAGLIATKPFYVEGLRQIGALLPQGDSELHKWLTETAGRADEDSFVHGLCAAALTNRKLDASLLPLAFALRTPPWPLACIAWRMEGEVTAELLRALEVTVPMKILHALALFVAAAWWLKHRPAEELPQRIVRYAKEFGRSGNLDEMDLGVLSAFATLVGPTAEKELASVAIQYRGFVVPNYRGKTKICATLEAPLETRFHERRVVENASREPIRRTGEKIGSNDKCPCGSGKKYKKCCGNRAVRANDETTKIAEPAALPPDLYAGLTSKQILSFSAAEVHKLDPLRLSPELQGDYLLRLGYGRHFETMIEAFEKLGVPKHLERVWSHAWSFASEQWRPDFARNLLKVFPDAEEKLGEKTQAALRFLMVGDDLGKAFTELVQSAEALVKSGNLEELQKLVAVVLDSPYRALGILLARGLLPIIDEKKVPVVFDELLAARAKLNLSPEDEFSGWMNQKALRDALEHETAAVHEARDALVHRSAETRRANEEAARLRREIALLKKSEDARRPAASAEAQPGEQTQAALKEKNAQLARVEALAREKGEGELHARRDLERLTRENEELRAALSNRFADEKEDEGREDFKASGNQPLRPIAYPQDFRRTLAKFKPHIGRAAMNRLGRLSAGEAAAFDKLKAIVALPGVLEARVSDRYRLLFSLLPNCIRVVDLVYRPDLDKAIERYKLAGLPAVPEFD